jgi:hypothetical protein
MKNIEMTAAKDTGEDLAGQSTITILRMLASCFQGHADIS